ncbi:PDR/VanB family oxidoreductase [Salinarimonas ramus]|uniref:Ferredoxin n=1 Tax=Salinarimonas ramus TaxID=690164 RepID=A0A917QGW4_9HYPH|nr:PDR/VanB family oxidoreductase [Salinarimonas ramus]GGK50190.1 ferredoxin [Salinarimonas ramus]
MTARIVMKLDVVERTELGDDVARLVFRHPRRPTLAAWTPGAHVDLRLPDGKVRQYSLIGDPDDLATYTIAVKREASGRGGSRLVHEALCVGAVAHVSAPRNNFPLAPGRAVLIAGGVGATPLISMARELVRRGEDFAFHLCVRTADSPFAIMAEAVAGERLSVHASSGEGARRLDVAALVAGLAPDVHLYCCGPDRLTAAVAEAAEGRDEDTVHFEVFAATADENYKPEPFDLTIASTGRTYRVPAERSALDVLREEGFALPSSCELGVCGSCECGYTQGTVIHRDVVLEPSARQHRMMPCVSRARVAVTLDL